MAERVRRVREARTEPVNEYRRRAAAARRTRRRTAFEQLYDLLAGPVFGLVGRIVRDPAQSEEVVQEVMVELWRTAVRYSPDRGTRPRGR